MAEDKKKPDLGIILGLGGGGSPDEDEAIEIGLDDDLEGDESLMDEDLEAAVAEITMSLSANVFEGDDEKADNLVSSIRELISVLTS